MKYPSHQLLVFCKEKWQIVNYGYPLGDAIERAERAGDAVEAQAGISLVITEWDEDGEPVGWDYERPCTAKELLEVLNQHQRDCGERTLYFWNTPEGRAEAEALENDC